MMKRLFCCIAILIGGCGTRTCKDQTVLVSLSLGAAAAQADRFDVTVVIGGNETLKATGVPRSSGSAQGTLEIEFPNGYPSKQMIEVTVTALAGATVVGSGDNRTTLDGACATLPISIGAPGDLSPADLPATVDLRLEDAAPATEDLPVSVDAGPPDSAEPPQDLTSPCQLQPGATAYVSQGTGVPNTDGIDDGAHGGGPGACAFRTIGYALQHATATIELSASAYSAAIGEVFPLVMTGAQVLHCNGASITGAQADAIYGSNPVTLVLSDKNSVSDCQFQPGTTTATAIVCAAAGDSRTLSIANNFFKGYAIAIDFLADPMLMSVNLSSNMFQLDSTADVRCGTSSLPMAGAGNSSDFPDAGPKVGCQNCTNCGSL
jgi:hypothetical protein